MAYFDLTTADFYMTQTWPDYVWLRLNMVFRSRQNLIAAARHFLANNDGFYLNAWGDQANAKPKAGPFGLSEYLDKTNGTGMLHFFPASELQHIDKRLHVDLPALDEYLARHAAMCRKSPI